MNVLSLFDGMGTCKTCLDRVGLQVDNFFASEVDKYAIAVAKYLHPDIVHVGDVRALDELTFMFFHNVSSFDLIAAGSPCKNLSLSGDKTGVICKSLKEYLKLKKEGYDFGKNQSYLFWEFVRLLEIYKPPYFFLENVITKKENQDIISNALNIEPIKINSALVSAQNRKRLYWSNIPGICQPEDKGILLKDIVLHDGEPIALTNLRGGFGENTPRVFIDKSPTLRTPSGGGNIPFFIKKDWIHSEEAVEYMKKRFANGLDSYGYSNVSKPKSATILASFFKGVPNNVLKDWDCYRKFHPIECERLQTLKDNSTAFGIFGNKIKKISNTQRYKMIGNGWNEETIIHLFEGLKDIFQVKEKVS